MNDEQAPDDIESQVAEFAAELDDGIDINLKGLQADVTRLISLLLAAPDSETVSKAIREFADAAQSWKYTSLVFDQVATLWALWVLHEGHPRFVSVYTRHLQAFVQATRAVCESSQSVTDSESFGGSAENGTHNV